jgi:hypothetical protein
VRDIARRFGVGRNAVHRHRKGGHIVESLVCPRCGSEMKVIAFIIDHEVVDKILRHLMRTDDARGRDPPQETGLSAVS